MGLSSYQELEDRMFAMTDSGHWDEAFEELSQETANGNKDATAILAIFYLDGIGIASDPEYGIELLNKALNLGSMEAAWNLGCIYSQNDLGIPVNKQRSFELFEKGAVGGHAECCGALSGCYLYGRGTTENAEKAFYYAMIAAKAGVPTGMVNAAVCYDDGLGTGPDPYAACHWYKEYLNYEPDDDPVMLRIALCLADPYERYGIRATDEMLTEAFYYAGKSVEHGNVEAHMIVGWFYEMGKAVQQDFNRAHKYVQIAADNGWEPAQRHLQRFRKNLYGNYYIPGL